MKFSADVLVLGAGTVLTEAEPSLSKSQEARNWEDNKICALLAATYGATPARSVLRHIRLATDCWSRGDQARADLHLALTGLPRLSSDGEQAKRLFFADNLIKGGLDPAAILKIVDVDPLS